MKYAAMKESGHEDTKKKARRLEARQKSMRLEKTVKELNGISTYLQMILDNSKALIVTTDRAGLIVEFNREGKNLLGYSKQELSGQSAAILFDDDSASNEVLQEWLEGLKEADAIHNREVVLKSKSGQLVYVNLTISRMVNEAGGIIGSVAIGKDISEEKRLQFKLMQAEKLVGIGTLATGIAHEINNPLAGVLGMAEAIRDEDDIETIKEHSAHIIKYATNAANIVKELSAYSRAATENSENLFDMSEVMASSLNMARHSISLSPIKVIEDLEKGCNITGTEGEMQQVFVNLILNAVQAMEESGTLSLRCYKDKGRIKAEVSDTGPGIPPEFINHIYDPFFTTKPIGLGTGLGLYVTYRIVSKHGGTIDVETAAKKGTTFILTMPELCEARQAAL
ncbi:MAG: nitrogen regulation protein NR(II) [Thermodesulfobacteriota bacterium]